MIILVLGLPGCGKSYFAERLAEKIGAEYVNSDRLRKALFPKRTYSEDEKRKVYEVMLNKMEGAIAQNNYLVLDATFHKASTREPFISKSKGNLRFIEIQVEEKIVRERLKKSRPFSEADFEVYHLLQKEWEPLLKSHLTLQSTNDNIEIMLQKAMEYLKDDRNTDR